MIVQQRSTLDQLDDARSAVVAVRLAEFMGLFERPVGASVDGQMVTEVIRAAARAGVAEEVGQRLVDDPVRVRALLRALVASPLPTTEIPRLSAVLGYTRLADLAGASEASLRRYAVGERAATDEVAIRIHFLAQLLALLRGSFNEYGIRRWFGRPRVDLNDSAPAALLTGHWDPEDDGPQRVLRLATALLA